MSTVSRKLSPFHLILVLWVVTLWGLSFVVIKLGLSSIPPLLFSALRFSLTTLPWIFFIPFPKQQWRAILVMGLLLGVGKFSLLLLALDGYITAGLSSLVLQSQVFFTLIISHWWFHESINSRQKLGLLTAFLGLLMLGLIDHHGTQLVGIVMILIAGLFWSIANNIIKTMTIKHLLPTMIWVFAIAPIPLFVLSYLFESQQPLTLIAAIDSKGWMSLVFLAYGSTLMAYGIWNHLLRSYTAIVITPFALLIPVIGLISSQWILQETLSNTAWLTVMLIMLGLIISVVHWSKSQPTKLTTFKTPSTQPKQPTRRKT